MINFPGAPQGATRPENQTRFPEGTHPATLASVRFNAKVQKLIVEYQSTDGQFFYEDWLGFGSEAQSKRSYAYICRLHELAGLSAPQGGAFDEKALVAAHQGLGATMQITLVHDGEYLNLADFPCALLDEVI